MHEILKAVLATMDAAEEIDGPEGDEYIALMDAIAREAEARKARYVSGR